MENHIIEENKLIRCRIISCKKYTIKHSICVLCHIIVCNRCELYFGIYDAERRGWYCSVCRLPHLPFSPESGV